VILVRYADDIVAGFEHQADAERFEAELRDRFGSVCALTLHPDKTRLIQLVAFGGLYADVGGGSKSSDAPAPTLSAARAHSVSIPIRLSQPWASVGFIISIAGPSFRQQQVRPSGRSIDVRDKATGPRFPFQSTSDLRSNGRS
jgi:hypothetical protein